MLDGDVSSGNNTRVLVDESADSINVLLLDLYIHASNNIQSKEMTAEHKWKIVKCLQ